MILGLITSDIKAGGVTQHPINPANIVVMYEVKQQCG